MISLSYAGDDPITRFGIQHFLKKSGLAIELNSLSKSDICISYRNQEPGIFSITLKESQIKNSVTGTISTELGEVPIFEIPFDTGDKDQALAWYQENGSSYPCVTRFEGGIKIGFNLFKETGSLLNGHLDRIWPHLDDHQKDLVAQKPLVDFFEDLLVRFIQLGCEQVNIPLARKAYWPEGKRFAVCLTHDVDEVKKTYQWITRPCRFLFSGDLQGLRNQMVSMIQKMQGKEPYWTFSDIIKIEQGYGVYSTFFFLKESAEAELLSPESWHHWGRTRSLENPEMKAIIRCLRETGFEVGLHGSFYSYKNPELLEKEKRDLEAITGGEIRGIRQHHLNLEIPLTWTIHETAKLSYDTSLGFKDRVGFRYGTCFPFHPLVQGEELKLLEIPVILMDITIPMNSIGWDACRRIIAEVERHQGLLTLIWHPPVFNDLEYPHAREMYQRIIELCRDRGAWITHSGEIFEWWSRREETGLRMKLEENTLKIETDPSNTRQYIDLFLPDRTQIRLDPDSVNIVINGSLSEIGEEITQSFITEDR
jgi:peptidoglycan/xylan/chitin deacetylase (PgdA/CDA1 family)